MFSAGTISTQTKFSDFGETFGAYQRGGSAIAKNRPVTFVLYIQSFGIRLGGK
jgi:hypothetical protein